jgi:hypothetical protein
MTVMSSDQGEDNMRKFLIGIVLITSLLALAPSTQAAPRYGYRWTAAHGYIVEVRGDARPSRYRCTWTAGGDRWVFAHYLPAYGYQWTTSDAGNWGNARPRNLDCNYVRL